MIDTFRDGLLGRKDQRSRATIYKGLPRNKECAPLQLLANEKCLIDFANSLVLICFQCQIPHISSPDPAPAAAALPGTHPYLALFSRPSRHLHEHAHDLILGLRDSTARAALGLCDVTSGHLSPLPCKDLHQHYP
jgi:hypothetical protein